MSSRADTTVGQMTARATTTTRRGTPWQDRSPFDLWPAVSAATAAFSQGHPPAHPRHAISIRVHQTGGAPTRCASTRRGHPPRPPPEPATNRATPYPGRLMICSRVPASRTPTASLRDRLRRSLTRSPIRSYSGDRGREKTGLRSRRLNQTRKTGYTIATPYSTLDRAVPHQVKAFTPLPARACWRRCESPWVATRWAWWRSLSTVAVASVLGMIVSKPDGWMLLVTAIERRS